MNGVLGTVELLLDTPLDAPQRDLAETARTSATALLTILNDILDFSKLDAGRLRMVETAFAPRGTLADCVDPGPGVTAEAQARLFQPFSQLDDGTTRAHGGTGLGLAIVRRLARAMGGDADVHSTPGVGSVFSFRVPVGVEPVDDAATRGGVSDGPPSLALPAASPRARAERRVLLVEDNAVNQKVACLLLAPLGVRIDVANDGVEAVEAARHEDYLLVLMDCHMPRMDGFEATRAIRVLDGPRARVPIVALTADATEESRARIRAAGMDAHLAKPVSRADLTRVLDALASSLSHAPPAPRRTA